ncbi:MAG: AAA family ATPase [Candidatus Poribacteria bacterium]|nr:AAA family ATPase [Candidatus Poribacteria bacterium]
MRITEIEIKNFKAFHGTYQIDLHKAGKNLLVYGENGSGKSSLYFALMRFLESGDDPLHRFENDQNIFIADAGYIKLCLRADEGSRKTIYEWSESVRETDDELIIEASKAKGFLDYKSLLDTHYLHQKRNTVNVFELLRKTLLANTVSTLTNRTLDHDWAAIQPPYPRRNATGKIADLEKQTEAFNTELTNRLAELQPIASEILGKFGHNVALNFDFPGIQYNRDTKTLDNQEILLTVALFDRDIPDHHHFLNEARLSAIAIAIYFSSILIQPESRLKILALDDVLIGLDTSNRLPVLDILNEYFPDHQIFLTTYDKTWYEIAKQRTPDAKWKYAEFYTSKTDEYEIPVYAEDKAYLEKAKDYFADNDYKASAIYLRTAFETVIKKFCEKKGLRVRYCENPKKLKGDDFWIPIKTGKRNDNTPFLEPSLINDIELYRSIILNPLSHSSTVTVVKKEISDAIKAVEKLKTKLARNLRNDPRAHS